SLSATSTTGIYTLSLHDALPILESVEFYAELLYKAKMLGGPKEFDQATVQKLYEIRRKMGLSGKHPADLCLNKNGKNCHNCGNGDRKSTRLNSSHVSISYAVFCL